MQLCTITPTGLTDGQFELRVYEVWPHTNLRSRQSDVTVPSSGCGEVAPQSATQSALAASDMKSLAVTAPEVASRMLSRCSMRGIRPATYREIATWLTPIISANLVCDIPLALRNSDNFMSETYHGGMRLQANYASSFFDPSSKTEYHLGMATSLQQLRLARGETQQELADAIGTQQSQISRWEHEPGHPKKRWPKPWWAAKLGAHFDVRWTLFLEPHLQDTGSFDALLDEAPGDLRDEVKNFIIGKLLRTAKADADAKKKEFAAAAAAELRDGPAPMAPHRRKASKRSPVRG